MTNAFLNTLTKICADKMEHVGRNEHLIPSIVHSERAKMRPQPAGFCAAIRNRKEYGSPALIAEVKKASPSKGIIRPNFDAAKIAMAYQQGGATCVSVLTDMPYFKGCDDDLEAVKSVIRLPVIRKDFILTSYQIIESRALGADCILLIVAALDDETLQRFYNEAVDLGMDVLVEIHNEIELDRALSITPMMIGVNARNLKTLTVDLATSFDLVQKIPSTILRIAESGISTHEELTTLYKAGYDGFLVGESLIRQDDITLATEILLGKPMESA